MKLFFSEFKPNYEDYSFPYQIWLLKEESDLADPIYNAGFLPTRHLPNVYYLSRSLRVNLNEFELSSENRRILGKTQEFESSLVSLSDFDYSPAVQKMCKDYVSKKIGEGVLGTQSIKGIFTNGIYNSVFVFKNREKQPVGYAVVNIYDPLLQYGYAFYDQTFIGQNLGARMMLEAIMWAKQNNKQFVYLGTGYQTSSLYKTEFRGVEFFNGFCWSKNLTELKKLISGLNQNKDEYLLKNEDFIDKFYPQGLETILRQYGTKVNF